MSGTYHTAQICLNGHVMTSRHDAAHDQKFCSICGEPTITQCERCGVNLRGYYEVPGVIDYTNTFFAPGFCYSCGQPFAWTARRLEAGRELAEELSELSEPERQTLKQSMEDLIRDTPRTELAGIRFKKIMNKAGKDSYEAMKNMLSDFLNEKVRKIIFGP